MNVDEVPKLLDDPDFAALIELDAIVLDQCTITRGEPTEYTPGRVATKFDVQYSLSPDLVFIVQSKNSFHNRKDELIADIDVSFAVLYSSDETLEELSPEDVSRYVNGRLWLQVLPFIREFLATTTNRMGLHPFYIPLFRSDKGKVIQPRRLDD